MANDVIRVKLIENGLKVTPQRIAVLEALADLKNHPTTENIIDHVKKNHPHVSAGTIYKTLDVFVEKEIVFKVKTDRDIMRYDFLPERHHHLYCTESDKVKDYFDDELNKIIDQYFMKKRIPDFKIRDIKLQIIGNFTGDVGDGSGNERK